MNFLSHYYFDRHCADANIVMGGVLPDLLKNAISDANLHPEKIADQFVEKSEQAILLGWEKHLAIDRYFHSSEFFKANTQELKILIKPILENSAIRPSFLAHIGLELLLDHLLIEHQLINVEEFYAHLAAVNQQDLDLFLTKSNLQEPARFNLFLERFLEHKYLASYKKLSSVSYALNQICLRLWPETLSDDQLHALTLQLEVFKINLEQNYISIFKELEEKLKADNF